MFTIGAVLLDQRIFAGIGNVYRAEILHLVRLHPETPSAEIDRATFDALWAQARALLAVGVKERRIVTVAHEGKKRLRRSEALHVYGRPTCRTCDGPVSRLISANRALYACEACQPRP